jgi:hypothetical protein
VLNNWVMHPVARVSFKYWKTSVRNTVFLVLDFIVHFSHYGSVEYIVTTLDIFCICEPPEDGHQMGPKHVV